MESPSVAVVVVSYNTKQITLECLDSVRSSRPPDGIELVVVDNGSQDGTPEMVHHLYPEARLLQNTSNLGFAAACNQGIRSTSAPFVLLLNSDARISDSTIDSLLFCMRSSDQCAAAACSLLDATGRVRRSTFRFLTAFNQALELVGVARLAPARFRRSRRPRPDANGLDRSVDWIEASCLILRRAALEQVGLLDERFFMYSEDEDLCWRLRRSGWLVCYTDRGRAIHLGGESAKQNPFQSMCHFYRSQYLLLMKHRGGLSAHAYILANRTALLLKYFWYRLCGRDTRARDARMRWTALSSATRTGSGCDFL